MSPRTHLQVFLLIISSFAVLLTVKSSLFESRQRLPVVTGLTAESDAYTDVQAAGIRDLLMGRALKGTSPDAHLSRLIAGKRLPLSTYRSCQGHLVSVRRLSDSKAEKHRPSARSANEARGSIRKSAELTHVAEKSEHNPGIFQEASFVNARGLELRAYSASKVDAPRGVVIVHHGLRVHGLYDILCSATPGGPQTCLKGSLAEFFLDNGFALYTYDCEGHGLSQSEACRGYFSDVWKLVDDLVHFASLVRKEHPSLPVFACACSLGGGICVGASIRDPSVFDGLVLAAPAVSVEKVKNKGVNKILVPLGPLLLRCFPCLATKRLVAFPKNADASQQKTFEEDPLTDSEPTLLSGPMFAIMVYCLDLVKKIANLSTPFLTMHARTDTSTDFESSEILMANASSADKTFLEPPPGCCHALFTDAISREWARSTAYNWLKERCTHS
eukprot:gnl/TRDRNA2_/TRDRNA2_200095_c0_seq1.p1 gnl/TRDRNA2_/TRDRNA2_200095_c0~~gnl/TRDRNA2_/TRDRNA2_200095_c0_seq1.p1  ORF type:complete len:444 (+),score=51.38 gnl/TRDRNA2_/TRDRNA2_200095_c0_seq1:174-1505(+)